MRCAECDCEHGGSDCNWIKTPNSQVRPEVWYVERSGTCWCCEPYYFYTPRFKVGPCEIETEGLKFRIPEGVGVNQFTLYVLTIFLKGTRFLLLEGERHD